MADDWQLHHDPAEAPKVLQHDKSGAKAIFIVRLDLECHLAREDVVRITSPLKPVFGNRLLVSLD
jgi:hypothetical protein